MESETPASSAPGGLHGADLELVRAARSGRREAVERLIARMRCVPRMLAAKNARMGRPLDDAELEDLVQESLYAIWRKLDTYAGRAALETWFYRFCFLELVRRVAQARRTPAPLTDVENALPAAITSERPGPFELEHVYRGLERLEPDEADAIRAKHLEELTFDEIGARLGVSPNTVKTRYYRGMLKLRSILGVPTKTRSGFREDTP